jgi:hypothetical protein
MPFEKLKEAFLLLPTTCDGLYDYFVKEGIKGIPKKMRECPVSRWVRREVERLYGIEAKGVKVETAGDVYVSRDVGWNDWRDSPIRETAEFKLCYGQEKFISNFDEGLYPSLQEGEARG